MSRLVWAILLVALALAGGVSLWASEAPDGLEHAMAGQGLSEAEAVVAAPMPDYEAPWIGQPTVRRVIAGLSGTLATAGLGLAVGWLLRRAAHRRTKEHT